MTKADLVQLRSEIRLNSLFVADYENSFGLDPHVVCNFFDGYVSHIAAKMEEESGSIPERDYFTELWKYDTDDNLEEWYYCFVEDPLGGPGG